MLPGGICGAIWSADPRGASNRQDAQTKPANLARLQTRDPSLVRVRIERLTERWREATVVGVFKKLITDHCNTAIYHIIYHILLSFATQLH